MLNPTNIMDYFSERSNPFYDRTCNNETIKMQRLSPEHLKYEKHFDSLKNINFNEPQFQTCF